MYATFITMVFNKCFSAIHVIPEKVVQWLGGQSDSFGKEEAQQMSQATQQQASQVAGKQIQLHFTPHLLPTVRGILDTVYGRLRDPGLTAEDCKTVLEAVYQNQPCIDVLPVGTYPATKWARQTNKALLSLQVDKRTGGIVLMSAIDNLLKGQAGQAIQGMNIMNELSQETGLPLRPFYP